MNNRSLRDDSNSDPTPEMDDFFLADPTHTKMLRDLHCQQTVTHTSVNLPPPKPPAMDTITINKDECLVCVEGEGDLQMLLRDFDIGNGKQCNKTMHVKCARLSSVPERFCFCIDCSSGRVLDR